MIASGIEIEARPSKLTRVAWAMTAAAAPLTSLLGIILEQFLDATLEDVRFANGTGDTKKDIARSLTVAIKVFGNENATTLMCS